MFILGIFVGAIVGFLGCAVAVAANRKPCCDCDDYVDDLEWDEED